jgi:hypothetical protein
MTNGRRLRVPVVAGVLATLAFASVGYAASADGRRAAGDAPATAATARLQALAARTAAPFPGFVLDRGRYVTVDVPGAKGTAAGEFNDRGQAVGLSGDVSADPGRDDVRSRAFLPDRGRFTRLDVPGARRTLALRIAGLDRVAGTGYLDAARTSGRGFLLADGPSGPFTPVAVPGSRLTVVFGFDNRRRIVGGYSRPGTAVSP